MFKPLDPKQSIPSAEEAVLELWRQRQIFKKTTDDRKDREPFVFYEGPPTANGKPGIHHLLSRTFKDTICRYQTMKGKYVRRKAGWDTHGLPVELQVEKALGLKNKQDIEAYGVAKFNDECRKSVWQYKEEFERLTERMGYWTDLEHPYITYETDYIASVWWGLRQVWDKGLIYKDYKVVPYCSRCGTALSLAEVAQGYKDVTETSVYIKFALVDQPKHFVLAWTTTPWTLPGNVALAVGPQITYVEVKQDTETYYLAKDRLSVLSGEYQVIRELPGSELVGKRYQPLFEGLDLAKESGKEAYRVVAADFVTTEDGTGVVHTAVMYGEEDFNLGKTEDLPAIHTVDEQGNFTQLVSLWTDRYVKDAEKDIIDYLSQRNELYKTEQTTHSYPFCWRCGTALLYYARSSWFIKISDEVRQRVLANNEQIKWVPNHIKHGRFGNWLEGLRDWAISRERYWGTPLPIWICQKDSNHQICVSGLEEMRQLATEVSTQKLSGSDLDLHKPFIDEIELTCPDCQGTMKRVPEVIDVWIDSGSMPFAQWGYPHQGKEDFDQQFPADYISEGIDQTRGWFNSLLILSTIIFDKPAYLSAITQNLLLDENGQKMSKSKGNVVDPWMVMSETGIDALRFYFMWVNQPGDNKNFSMKAVQEVYRKTIMIWWNVASFFLTYASIDQWTPDQQGEQTILDQWIINRANQTAAKIDQSLGDLDTFNAARAFSAYIDDLSTWYLRRSRKRREAGFYATLHQVLIQTSAMAAPMMPFISEATYQQLRTDGVAESVHLLDYPVGGEINDQLLADMEKVRQLVTLGHAARVNAGLRVRQPLAAAATSTTFSDATQEYQAILKEELNVKAIVTEGPEDWPQATEGQYSVAVDPTLTAELKEEGVQREIVRQLQDLRKKAGCQPGQPAAFYYQTENAETEALLTKLRPEILKEVSGTELSSQSYPSNALAATLTMEEGSLMLGIVPTAHA